MTCRFCQSGYGRTADGMHYTDLGFVGECLGMSGIWNDPEVRQYVHDAEQEITTLHQRVKDCEGAIERREQALAEASNAKVAAENAEAVAWSEVEKLQARVAQLESDRDAVLRYVWYAFAEDRELRPRDALVLIRNRYTKDQEKRDD